MKRILLTNLFACLLLYTASTQDKLKIKFGKVDPEEFKPTVYAMDSNTSAVILADVGSTKIVGNTKGWFSLEHKHFRRVHILNKNGYDIGNVSVSLYHDNNNREEELVNLKAYTYNLENGKITESKLDTKNGVFKEKNSKNWVTKKFTLPNIKEGSIIEYEYVVKSDFLFNLQPWEFQGAYPRLWSEYVVSIPQFLGYVFLNQGYIAPYIKDTKDRMESFSITDNATAGASDRYNFSAGVTDHRWVMKDVPVLKEENFTSTLDNHIAKIEFQLSEYKEPLTYKKVMGTWPQLAKEMIEADYFAGPVRKDNNWLKDMVNEAVQGATANEEKARRIYQYVQNNFTRVKRYGLYLDQNLRNIVKTKKGSGAEINLLLAAMLRYAGITADPVILSTRSNGYTYDLYPLISRFNYVVVQAQAGDRVVYLDAGEPRMAFGKLPYDCYNGHARVINETIQPVYLVADSLMEKKITSVFIINNKEEKMEGSFQQTPGYYQSASLRERINDKGEEQFFSDIKKGFNAEVEIDEPTVSALKNYDDNLQVKYKFLMNNNGEDIIYLNPLLSEAYKSNPFKSAERYYPVEMPYGIDEVYLLRLEVPKGYKLDEMPKQVVVKLNEEDPSFFEYRISESANIISLRSRLFIKRTYYSPEEYELLREFFNLVVKKQSEQIVFKKI